MWMMLKMAEMNRVRIYFPSWPVDPVTMGIFSAPRITRGVISKQNTRQKPDSDVAHFLDKRTDAIPVYCSSSGYNDFS